jgi:potassium-transporting ATPase KdpC subunit
MELRRNLLVSVLMTVATTVLLGVAYPLAVTALAQMLFPAQANGQLIYRNGKLVGSRLVGQPFASPGYFRARPSAAGAAGYDARASGGTNLGPTNAALVDAVRARTAAARIENPGVPVPIDLVTSSASGLDPDISPAAASFQVPRVARERGVTEAAIGQLVSGFTRGRALGVFGEPRVNVLLLNLALDDRYPVGGSSSPAKR